MPAKRAWRKLVKKQQRHRRRQKYAQEQEKQEELEQSLKEAEPTYKAWLQQQAELEEFQRLASEREQAEAEEAWLRREALAQRQFHIDAAKRRKEEAELERLRALQAEELAAMQEEQQKKSEESKRLAEKAAAEFEEMLQRMHNYMEDTNQKTPPPELRRIVETHPEERLCEFYTRTNCCRYGHSCTFNHQRPMLAKIIVIRHFFHHPLLQTSDKTHKEYANADAHLEQTDRDLRDDYDVFFNDVVAELEKFGKIINFRTVCNTLPHLRGHVFVEYAQERFALCAFIKLQGRYYASRRLSVEFSNLKAWRGAVCGNSCGYLHIFRNPNNLFNTSLEPGDTPKTNRSGSRTPIPTTPSWNDSPRQSPRNWRWSESPELELKCSQSSTSRSPRQRSKDRESSSKPKRHNSHSSRDSKPHRSQSRSASRHERSSSRDNSVK